MPWLAGAMARLVGSRFLDSIRIVLDACRRSGHRVALIGGFALPFHGVMRATDDVDFLLDIDGSDALHEALVETRFECLHRSDEAANYSPGSPAFAPVDVIYARRPPTQSMLAGARALPADDGRLLVPVVGVEGIVGLKAQAITNDPRRRRRDEDDIIRLLAASTHSLDVGLLRSYFALLDRELQLETLLDEARSRKP